MASISAALLFRGQAVSLDGFQYSCRGCAQKLQTLAQTKSGEVGGNHDEVNVATLMACITSVGAIKEYGSDTNTQAS
jgi:hypothetical protein